MIWPLLNGKLSGSCHRCVIAGGGESLIGPVEWEGDQTLPSSLCVLPVEKRGWWTAIGCMNGMPEGPSRYGTRQLAPGPSQGQAHCRYACAVGVVCVGSLAVQAKPFRARMGPLGRGNASRRRLTIEVAFS